MTDKPRLISCVDAAALGVERLRKPAWANPLDHLKIDIIDGKLGPWMHLYAPFNQECNGRDPVNVLWAMGEWGDMSAPAFVPYDGPLPDSEEYRADVQRYSGVLS